MWPLGLWSWVGEGKTTDVLYYVYFESQSTIAIFGVGHFIRFHKMQTAFAICSENFQIWH